MTSGDVVAILGGAATFITASAGAITLIRRHSSDLSKKEQQELEDCSATKRVLRRIIRTLRDLLEEHGIPEPEGLDDELAGKRAAHEG